MAKASIQIRVDYSVPGGAGGTASVSTEMPNGTGKALSGSGDSDGAKSTLVTEAGGTETTTEDHDGAPPNATVTRASITLSLNCPGGAAPITLEDNSNHSVQGRVDGNCIETIAVNKVRNGLRVVTTTRKKRRCCGDGAKAAAADTVRDELVAFKEEIRDLLDEKFDAGAAVDGDAEQVWLGLRLSGDDGPRIGKVLSDSPAEDAGLKPGDRLIALNDTPLEEAGGLGELLAGLSPFSPIAISLQRGKKDVSVELAPAPRLAAVADIVGAFSMDRACGDDCECSKKVRRSLCGKAWRYLGDGPNGGVMYEELCITIQAGNPNPIEHSCGAGEYF